MSKRFSNKGRVSYIVPSYNHADFIEQTVRAVWAQTHGDIELIVIDDGSRDQSPALLERLLAISPIPMKIRSRENRGLNATLNEGLALATGEFLAVCASDDAVLPDHAERLVAALAGTSPDQVGFAYGDVEFMTFDGHRTGRRQLEGRGARSGKIFHDIITRRFFPQGSANLYRIQALEEVGAFDESCQGEGLSLYLRLTKKYEAVFVDKALSLYRLSNAGLNADIAGRESELIGLMEQHLPQGDKRATREIRSAFYLSLARSHYAQRSLAKSIRLLGRSFKQAPSFEHVELAARIAAQSLLMTFKSGRR